MEKATQSIDKLLSEIKHTIDLIRNENERTTEAGIRTEYFTTHVHVLSDLQAFNVLQVSETVSTALVYISSQVLTNTIYSEK